MLLGSLRAIKRIRQDSRFYESLRREALILKNLKHPNIPMIYDVEEEDDFIYIIEEYLEGESLKTYMLEPSHRNKEMVLDFAIQVSGLLEYLHQQTPPILYLDLKPDNLLVWQQTLKLLDFGAAVRMEPGQRMGAESWGTRGYAAPEQYDGLMWTDPRSDIYGFGMLFFYMMTGESYENVGEERFSQMLEHLEWGEPYRRFLKRCIKQSLKERFQGMDEVIAELKQLQQQDRGRKSILHSKQKNTGENSAFAENRRIVIALAGAQHRIGTTHAGIMISIWLAKSGMRCAYLECNDSHMVEKLCQKVGGQDGICQYKGVTFVSNRSWHRKMILTDLKYDVCLMDMGVLNQENQALFYQTQYPCLVVGLKFWEELSWMESDEACFLVNFVSEDYEDEIVGRRRKKCVRLPYLPDPFRLSEQINAKEFEELKNIFSIGKRKKRRLWS